VSAGAQTPPVESAAAGALPVVRHEVVDPADPAQVAWLAGVLARGQGDLYAQDEADLALLPTLTRTWMPRGAQLRVPAPGTNAKRSVSAAADLAVGTLLWRTDDTRCADQFCALGDACAARSAARGRLAALLVDNAQAHRVGQTGIVRRWLNARAGRIVLVFLPPYSPDLQPAERLWRQWRPNVTHNHTRATLAELQADSDHWLRRHAAQPLAVLRALGPTITQPLRRAA
jgi:DDE superfamily endonuclease